MFYQLLWCDGFCCPFTDASFAPPVITMFPRPRTYSHFHSTTKSVYCTVVHSSSPSFFFWYLTRDVKVRFRTKVWTWTFQNWSKVWSKVQQIAGLDQKSGPVFGQQGKISNLFELGLNQTYGPWPMVEIQEAIWLVDNENNKHFYINW